MTAFPRRAAMMPLSARRNACPGFTLIEALVVMAIAAILMVLAVPGFHNTLASSRNSDAANTLISAIDLARSEAVRRGLNVTICRATDVVAALPTCGGAGDWADGWFIFVDNFGVQGVRDAGDNEILFRQQALNGADGSGSRITASVNLPVSFVGALSYQPNGLRLPLAGDPTPPFRFEIGYRALSQTAPGLAPRCLQVSFTGQSAVTREQCPSS